MKVLGQIASVVVECERGVVTVVVGAGGKAMTVGTLVLPRRCTKDESIVLRKHLMGQPIADAQKIVCRVLDLPAGREVHVAGRRG